MPETPATPTTTTAAKGAGKDWRELIKPVAPHDDLTFEELASRYNFQLNSDRRRVFARLIIKECEKRAKPVRVLDIGCGRGIGRIRAYQEAIRPHVDEFWGIEPDTNVQPGEGLFDNFQHALMETAKIPDASIDIAYSFMVMEHVADPEAFISAVYRKLKPGGVHLFMTPNGAHYFTIIAGTLNKMGLDEFILKLVKPKLVEKYHYPVCYRFNRRSVIDRTASIIGFHPPEYAYLEPDGPRDYLPGPLKLVFHALVWKRKVLKDQRCLLDLTCRMTKRG